jgi:8-oxo-dGTP diphosphatase
MYGRAAGSMTKGPKIAVDCIITLVDRPHQPVVLVQRRFPPLGWALPGGFAEAGESAEQAAAREAREETGLEIQIVDQLGCYSDPARDPRGPTWSIVFLAQARGHFQGADDAAKAEAFTLWELPSPLCFDHGRILDDYQRLRLFGARPHKCLYLNNRGSIIDEL